MSTPTDEIAVDLEAADARAAAEAEKNKTNGKDNATEEVAEVEKVDSEPKASEKTALTTDQGLEKLKKELEDERTRRQDAENRATEAARAEAAARGEAQTSQLDLVKGAIERLTESNDTLENQYADAMAAQDWKAAAKAQRQMADNAAKLAHLEAGKKALESAPKPVPRAPADPVEQFCSQLSPASATWVRSHPEFVRDPHKNRQMIAAHELALARGHKADTPEYFASVEKTLDIAAPMISKTDSQSDPTADAAQAIGGRTAPAAAPVSRNSNGANGSRPGVLTLKPHEVEIAHLSFPDLSPAKAEQEYARQIVALRKEGRLS